VYVCVISETSINYQMYLKNKIWEKYLLSQNFSKAQVFLANGFCYWCLEAAKRVV